MPDPILSSASSRRDRTGDDDLTCRTPLGPTSPPPADEPGAGGACALDLDWASNDLAQGSVDYSRVAICRTAQDDGAAGTDAGSSASKGPAIDNARRTAARAAAPYAEAGALRDGFGYFAAVAADKGTGHGGLTSREILSLSAQAGAEIEAQAAIVRGGLALGDGAFTATLDLGTARANVGVVNGDGSYGLNAGAVATLVSAEATATLGRLTLTGGLGIGVGMEASGGIRDADDDGEPEVCVRFAGALGGKGVVGGCIEL
jgi:hypothetical protein